MWVRRLILIASVVLLTALNASPTDYVVVNLYVTTARQDSPVQILGFKLYQ